MTKNWSYAVAIAALLAAPAAADVWDIQASLLNDDNNSSRNTLLHGTSQTHDLGVRPGPVEDSDWYRIPQKPQASYEVIIDGTSGGTGVLPLLDRIGLDGSTVVQTATAAVTGSQAFSQALRWVNTSSSTVDFQYLRVAGAACGTTCNSADVYTIRVRETTVNVARFNATGGQVTVLLTQNASERPVNLTQFFWSVSGTLLGTRSLASHPAKALDVFNVASLPATVGQSGSITVAHDGGHGGLVVKAVALEPATGFSFDTTGVYVPD